MESLSRNDRVNDRRSHEEPAMAAPTSSEKLKNLEKQLERETTLRRLSDRIHASSIDDLLLKVRADIQTVLGGERVTIYVVDPARNEIFSKLKDGEEIKEIRIPISNASIAGFVAQNRKVVRLKDAAGLERTFQALKPFDKRCSLTVAGVVSRNRDSSGG
jgi:hypothetical protein